MTGKPLSYHIFPFDDSAITIDFGNIISLAVNDEVVARFHDYTNNPLPRMMKAVPAHSSLTVYYDVVTLHKGLKNGESVYNFIKVEIEKRLEQPVSAIPGGARGCPNSCLL